MAKAKSKVKYKRKGTMPKVGDWVHEYNNGELVNTDWKVSKINEIGVWLKHRSRGSGGFPGLGYRQDFKDGGLRIVDRSK